ncbi:uncharacterized protein [Ptychodera flava]|uniref:uncharacterized protein n=1 Tax=Ptychodera flava TaxID=63121 RepID=UPI00396A2D38
MATRGKMEDAQDECHTFVKPSEIKQLPRWNRFVQALGFIFSTVLKYPYRKTFSSAGGTLHIGPKTKIIVPNIGNDTVRSRRVCVKAKLTSNDDSHSHAQVLVSPEYKIKTERFNDTDNFIFEFAIDPIDDSRYLKVVRVCDDYEDSELEFEYNKGHSTIKTNIEKPVGVMTIYSVLHSNEVDVSKCILETVFLSVSVYGQPSVTPCMNFTVRVKSHGNKKPSAKASRPESTSADIRYKNEFFMLRKYQDLKIEFRAHGEASNEWLFEDMLPIDADQLKMFIDQTRTFPFSLKGGQGKPLRSQNFIMWINSTDGEELYKTSFTVPEEEISKSKSDNVASSHSLLSLVNEDTSQYNIAGPEAKGTLSSKQEEPKRDSSKAGIRRVKSRCLEDIDRLCVDLEYDQNSLYDQLVYKGRIVNRWKNVARKLGSSEHEISTFAGQSDPGEQIIQMITTTQQKYLENMYLGAMIRALIENRSLNAAVSILVDALLYTIAQKVSKEKIDLKPILDPGSTSSYASSPEKSYENMVKENYTLLLDKKSDDISLSFIREIRDSLRQGEFVERFPFAADLADKAESVQAIAEMVSSLGP